MIGQITPEFNKTNPLSILNSSTNGMSLIFFKFGNLSAHHPVVSKLNQLLASQNGFSYFHRVTALIDYDCRRRK